MAALRALGRRTAGFLLRQPRMFQLMLARRALHGVASNLTVQYNSLYATALGASPVQLGLLQGAGNAVAALVSLPAGWLIDTHSLKKVMIVGTIMLVSSGLVYSIAPHWTLLYAGIVLYIMGSRITCTACTVIGATELANRDRATARGLCRTLSSVVVLTVPMVAAWIISLSGGIGVAGMRPLYIIQSALFVAILLLLALFLRDRSRTEETTHRRSVLKGFAEVFAQHRDAARIMIMVALMDLPWSMAQPFTPLFAHQCKGADEFILGGMAVALNVVPLLFSIPLGRLADRWGRKKVLFALAPLAYASNLCLVFAPGRYLLIVAGLLFGFNSISMGIATAMASEIVSRKQMGKWISIVTLVRGLVSIPAPFIGGLLWDHIGPSAVFVVAIAIDAGLRLPLLASIRETLDLDVNQERVR